ncbi:hypothetical protein C5F48_07740 [Cereibacter changlensis JA139]|uniref:Penicillin-binding protein transpeptidase domain-containing protein n=2 Tax=Cereibacter changlensis TaxID=402884 RepID=A0A2T4JWS3_9RHOB|nr:penicillin-binding transpeptidase domain-containing protein [Cereibacter changlensis]PTE22364.1 hypothetical protein C5F48_07740 [Cereibacter changlensis JA139]PZX54991.1 uncharacterized protein DUF1349 [Cereibacter changlensis]
MRISSASTFKVAISLMGFDAGTFTAPDAPDWPFKEGYADWNPRWKRTTTPESWMRDSVVWYSQRATEQLGMKRFAAYVDAFDYGNEDVSGDEGEGNGLANAWLSSSLQISPIEHVGFLARMIEGKLHVSSAAVAHTKELMHNGEQAGGLHFYGKTGAGMPFGPDGALRGRCCSRKAGKAANDCRSKMFHLDGLRWPLLGLCPFPQASSYLVGPMCCSPERDGLKVRFSEFQIGAPVGKVLHDLT